MLYMFAAIEHIAFVQIHLNALAFCLSELFLVKTGTHFYAIRSMGIKLI